VQARRARPIAQWFTCTEARLAAATFGWNGARQPNVRRTRRARNRCRPRRGGQSGRNSVVAFIV